ncbi:hypothetical protein U0070_025395 [Myodes glareolus]|uniref:PH domain-containing protein n=1 Tax=Myodes glareolus TaxID=447135 RepID=A0AAW0IYN8_MYOGA
MGQFRTSFWSFLLQLGTKEGYLTKQGGLVKTWKTRWFTLQRNELKYFKDQMSPEPIRILDLTECSAVQFDYSQERVNCFCLVFPFRTFYLCAKTGVEADEWIKILRWKLDSARLVPFLTIHLLLYCFMRNPRTVLAPTPTWKAVPRADIPGQRRLYSCAVGALETGARAVPVN